MEVGQGEIKRFGGVIAGVGGDFPRIDFASYNKIPSKEHFSSQLEPHALLGSHQSMLDSTQTFSRCMWVWREDSRVNFAEFSG